MTKCNIGVTVLVPLAVEVAQSDGRVMSVTIPTTEDVEAANKAQFYAVVATRGCFTPDVYGPFVTEATANEKAAELRARHPECNINVEPLRKS